MKTITRLLFLFFVVFTFTANAQITQTLRGNIIDKAAETPLVGAAVVVDKISPQLGAFFTKKNNRMGRM